MCVGKGGMIRIQGVGVFRLEQDIQPLEDNPDRLYHLDRVAHIVGVINDEETFGECPKGADEETVRRYARAYIMMLLGTQLLADKSGTYIHIRWLPYVARLEDMGGYSWGSAALAWLYRCMCRVAVRY
ncbi:hypothetical protein Ahy_A06g027523 [Arachis hypogaea]|uniref:Aminotransferase-like plant mobile domain-containing protein n=1 Tax=Arachis hypogaea TaxID=3818 RepID=A0A445CNX7_ARAHY|nr:hypothetical protein Ahy_A06g027523 [Arachis hypogaea]